MYRQVLIPNKRNSRVTLPEQWYGQQVEVIAFPLYNNMPLAKENRTETQWKKLNTLLNKYSFDTTKFKFDRNEANNYD